MARPSSRHTSLQQVLERAIGAHQQGRLGEAERLYSEILAAEPEHFDAQHLLGIVRHQQGRGTEALELIGAALKAKPDSAQALSNQGLVLYELRRYDEALASFERALALRPDLLEARNNRGNALQPPWYSAWVLLPGAFVLAGAAAMCIIGALVQLAVIDTAMWVLLVTGVPLWSGGLLYLRRASR